MGFQFTEAFNEAATNDDIYSRCAAPAVHHEPRNERNPLRFVASFASPRCFWLRSQVLAGQVLTAV